jgi:hypothetical protein
VLQIQRTTKMRLEECCIKGTLFMLTHEEQQPVRLLSR